MKGKPPTDTEILNWLAKQYDGCLRRNDKGIFAVWGLSQPKGAICHFHNARTLRAACRKAMRYER